MSFVVNYILICLYVIPAIPNQPTVRGHERGLYGLFFGPRTKWRRSGARGPEGVWPLPLESCRPRRRADLRGQPDLR